MENKTVDQAKIDQQYAREFTDKVFRSGRIWNLVGVLLSFAPALYIAVAYKSFPGVENILKGWALVVSIYGVYYFIEPISYFPILGTPGTLMGFISGNLGNMRVPCSAIAQDAVGVEPGTKKAELVSTLGIAGSIITNLIATLVAAVAGKIIMDLLPQPVLDAFKYIAPAIFGSMFAMFMAKDFRYGIFSLAITVAMIQLGFPTFVMVPVAVFATIIFAVLIDKSKVQGGQRND